MMPRAPAGPNPFMIGRWILRQFKFTNPSRLCGKGTQHAAGRIVQCACGCDSFMCAPRRQPQPLINRHLHLHSMIHGGATVCMLFAA